MGSNEITLMMHVERAEGEICWWAETDDVAGFSALAPTLSELRERTSLALDEILGVNCYQIREKLVGKPSVTPAGDVTTTTDSLDPVPT